MPLSNRTCFQVNLRDCLACRVCGSAPQSQETYHRGFQYHHVQFQSRGGPDEPENLILLCRVCHTRLHQNKLTLPFFDEAELQPIATFPCLNCGANLQSESVEMNCGWYRCDQCREKTHLFQHCGYARQDNDQPIID